MFKNMTIKVKLLLLTVIALVGLSLSISSISLNSSENILLKEEFSKLQSIRSTKELEIEEYFLTLRSLLLSLSENEATKEAFNSFEDGFYKLKKEISINQESLKNSLEMEYKSSYLNLVNYNVPDSAQRRDPQSYIPKNINAQIAQYIFINQNPAPLGGKNALNFSKKYDSTYMQAHKKFHNSFNSYLNSFNLYDIFLIDLKGNVIYTDFKEKDFATNLRNGVYKDTGLARVYNHALTLDKGNITFEDFKPYEPSYNNYASFIATPLFINHKLVGVLAIQTPSEEITKIMNFDEMYQYVGLGESGECYLVGSDYAMRNNSRFQESSKNKIVQALKTTIGVLKIKTDSTLDALEKDSKEGNLITKNYRGVETLSSYAKFTIFENTHWVILAEISKEEALKPLTPLVQKLGLTSLLIMLFVTSIVLYLVHILVNKPLEEFKKSLLHFFAFLQEDETDIKELTIYNKDEIGKMAESVNQGITITKQHFQEKKNKEWIRDGVGKLNAQLTEVSTTAETASQSIHFLCSYLDAQVGVLYLYDESHERLHLEASYAYDQEEKSYKLGEGIIGEVAQIQTPIHLKDSTEIDLHVQSALINKEPKESYIFSLTYANKLIGVIEIASLKAYSPTEIDLLLASVRTISAAISTSIQNTKVQELLEDANSANTNLELNQKKLEEANAYMEEQQQHLEVANVNMEEQQQQLEEANANMEEQQQQLQISEQNLKIQNESLENAKKELEENAKALREADKYKSEFLANMSHELRTPLNAIILLSQLLEKNKKANLDEDDIKKAHTIYNSGNELLRLINDILDLSKVEAGKMELDISEFHSQEFLENIQNLFEHSVEEKGLHFEVVDNYRDTIVSDSNRISQIVRNLISNALKFTTEGTIKIELSRSKDLDKPIKITVSDTGIGIPPEKQERIFQAFTQADGSTSRQYGGTGLGLSISKELTALLHGEITLKSQEGEGSSFTLLLADLSHNTKEMNTIEAEIIETQNIELIQPKILDDRAEIREEYAILVIEDDKEFAQRIYEKVKEKSLLMLLSENAKESLELIKEHNIAAIILNINLLNGEGTEILKVLKNDEKMSAIPIYITSKEDREAKKLNDTELESFILFNHTKVESSLEEKIEENEDFSDLNVDLSHINILLVDDDIKNIFVLDSAFSEFGAEVQVAYNGKEALEKLHEDKSIDIVLMDIMMPIMDGYEAIEEIRKDQDLKHLPIIAVTAKAMREDRDKCISLGADDFVSKPLNIQSLVKLVAVWSDKERDE